MNIHQRDLDSVGNEIWSLAARLFPIARSMTGNGVRETLRILQTMVDLKIHEVATGTKAFDWTIPQEWNIRDAYVKNREGERVIDFRASNLHLVNGSRAVRETMSWSDLKKRLHTLPEHPDRIPYRTCFFKDDWGFCLSQRAFDQMEARGEQSYEVVIDATVEDGSLTYGEVLLPGTGSDEVLISTHVCHPSLANDNLSGICIAAMLARQLAVLPDRRHSYRFLFAPATIGAIAWLSRNQENLGRIRHGLVLSLLGDPGRYTYKRSRVGNARIDRIVSHVLQRDAKSFEIRDFTPFGYDERQFCSPGINLPMGCLMRTPAGEFSEYHTSGDNLDFIRPQSLADSFAKLTAIIGILEDDVVYRNCKPYGEPRLDRYRLYESLPKDAELQLLQQSVQWVLNLSDGEHSLFEIAERSGLDFDHIRQAADRLRDSGLISPVK